MGFLLRSFDRRFCTEGFGGLFTYWMIRALEFLVVGCPACPNTTGGDLYSLLPLVHHRLPFFLPVVLVFIKPCSFSGAKHQIMILV